VISEEEEGADYDECFPQNSESTEELPLIRDVDRSKFGMIDQAALSQLEQKL
jgi:hypothetical protein